MATVPAAETPTAPSRLLTWGGYASFVMLGWVAVLVPSVIRSVQSDFHQGDAAFGFLYLVKAVLFAAGALGGGFLTERFGRRRILLLGLLIPGVSLIGAALSPVWWLFLVANAVVSGGSSFVDAGVNGLFLDLYRDARGSALNLLHLFFSVGALVGPVVIGGMITVGWSWRLVLAVSGIAFLLAVPSFLLTPMPAGRRDRTRERAAVEAYGAERSLLPFVGLALGIALYTGAEMGVGSWVVRLLSTVSLERATAVLSIFWLGLALGRLTSRWAAERIEYTVFTAGSMLLASAALALAVLTSNYVGAAVLFGLSGFFYGPVYPMIMVLGGNIYPHRLAALSGSLTTAGALGVIVYPPLMGFLAAHVGLHTGMLGAAALGVPCALAVVAARQIAGKRGPVEEEPAT